MSGRLQKCQLNHPFVSPAYSVLVVQVARSEHQLQMRDLRQSRLQRAKGISETFCCKYGKSNSAPVWRPVGDSCYFDHFAQEWRHANGMRCLGIPNTAHFANVTKIEDATACKNISFMGSFANLYFLLLLFIIIVIFFGFSFSLANFSVSKLLIRV